MTQVAKKQDIDYQSLGLKCGLEIHQQLDTGRKLFCHCKADLRKDNPMSRITRHMRPTLSEMGNYDKAALMEFKKQRVITYEIHDSICTYEIDETPPFDIDANALDLALSIARLFQMEIIDESHINRKQYLDGSIPAGFQRTMIIGTGGKIKAANKTINLDILALEEDSCREITNIGRNIIWRVDRLGTPLVEIATKTINITEPEEIRSIAEGIGRILRATGKVKRGLGTIRQDLNISIEKGARIEIKGIQILDMLPEYVRLEVSRQLALLDIKNELLKRKVIPDNFTNSYQDCETIFKKTKCKFIIEALKRKEKILGLKLPKIKGILGWKVQGNRTFGKEIADRVKVITGLGGILHSDELPNYGITQEELDNLYLFFNCKATDAVTIVIGKNEDAIQAIEEIIIRVKEALLGVPEETRHALDDGITSFRRYLGGASRMYPDTDTRPIVITENRIKRIEENLPELPDKKEERYIQEFNLPEEIAKNLAISSRAILFDELVKSGIDPILAAVTLEQTIKALAREETPVENLTDRRIKEIFELLLKKKIAKDALEPLLKYFCENPKDKIESAMKKLNLKVLSENELIEIIDKIINNNLDLIKESSNRAKSALMGQVMAEVRGKIDGQLVNTIVEKRFNIKLKELGKE